MSRKRRRRLRSVLLLVMACAATAITVKYTRHYVFPKRFAVVEPGRLYRAGYCEPGPLGRVIRKHQIRTILTLLNEEPDSPEQQKEADLARREGVRVIRIPMPGNGRAEFSLLEQAADVMAEPAHQPLLVHCYGGVNRTGAVCALWRMKYCGWSCEQALAEAEERGMSRRFNPALFDHIRAWAAQRASAARSSSTLPTSGSPAG